MKRLNYIKYWNGMNELHSKTYHNAADKISKYSQKNAKELKKHGDKIERKEKEHTQQPIGAILNQQRDNVPQILLDIEAHINEKNIESTVYSGKKDEVLDALTPIAFLNFGNSNFTVDVNFYPDEDGSGNDITITLKTINAKASTGEEELLIESLSMSGLPKNIAKKLYNNFAKHLGYDVTNQFDKSEINNWRLLWNGRD